MNSDDSTVRPECSRTNPCNRPRKCPWCARRRQGRIADAAEMMAASAIADGSSWAMLTVIKATAPTAANTRMTRAQIIAELRRLGCSRGMWTVEKGEEFGALHVNLLHLMPDEVPPQHPAYEAHHSIIRLTTAADLRPTAAYISKQTAMPPPEQYSGRLYGGWGLQHISALMIGEEMRQRAPAVAAEALEQLIDKRHGRTAANNRLPGLGRGADHAPAQRWPKVMDSRAAAELPALRELIARAAGDNSE